MPREHPERFASAGLRTGSPADALKPTEYIMLKNVRGNTPTELTTRDGFTLKFATENNPVKNISSYTSGATPRYLAVVSGNVYLDDGTVVDTGYTSDIPSMVPFRPAQSPEPWMYIGDESQYRKLSSPSPTVTAQNVGIEEPQAPPELTMGPPAGNFVDEHAGFTNSGTAGAVTNTTRITDTVVAIFPDPNGDLETWQISSTVSYQRLMQIHFTNSLGASAGGLLPDVFTPLPANIAISGIEYYIGNTGLCVVVPTLEAPGPGNEQSIFAQAVIANLRRGALVQIGAEICYVLDVETGPLGTICFTTSTVNTHTAAETMQGIPAVQFYSGNNSFAGMAIAAFQWKFHVGTGVGTIQDTFFPGGSIFVGTNGVPFQPDDYVKFAVNVSDLSKLTEIKLLFDVNNGTANFTDNVYYYATRPSDIQQGVDNTLTQLGAAQQYSQRYLIDEESKAGHNVPSSKQLIPGSGQWSEIVIPIREMIRIGSDDTRTLLDMQGVQILVNCTGGIDVGISGIFVFGQNQPDVGNISVPYTYRVRGRSSVTGARSNPSPASRYGWSPRRQGIEVFTPSIPDSQMDLWDIFRMGGTIDTYRLVGTIPSGVGAFRDNFPDTSISASEVLEYDNLQPWPTIDLPLNVPTGVSANGTIVRFTLAGGTPQLTTIPRYLPGNIVRINQTAYTLWNRPTVSVNTVTMLLVENADVVTNGALFIYEPLMANQTLPFIWGPTAEGGTMFGVGDTNRPGTVYFTKNFNPDSVPDKYNLELAPPSEPLVGGLLHAGESLCFSNVHWWALRPSFGGQNQYTARLIPCDGGCVSHFAACSDGKEVYYVAKDGVRALFSRKLLTPREKIYTLFPHEGVPGKNHTALGETVFAPEYEQVQKFRLCCANGFLYFDYIPQAV